MNKKNVAVGIGLAAAASAGYYFFGSKNAAKHRAKSAVWAKEMKRDVVKKAKTLKKLDERAYKAMVDEAMRAYVTMKSVDKKDVQAAAKELKEGWEHIRAEVARTAKRGARTARSSVKKASRAVKGKSK